MDSRDAYRDNEICQMVITEKIERRRPCFRIDTLKSYLHKCAQGTCIEEIVRKIGKDSVK